MTKNQLGFQKHTLDQFLSSRDTGISYGLHMDRDGIRRTVEYLSPSEYVSDLGPLEQRIFLQLVILSDRLHLNIRTPAYWKYGEPEI